MIPTALFSHCSLLLSGDRVGCGVVPVTEREVGGERGWWEIVQRGGKHGTYTGCGYTHIPTYIRYNEQPVFCLQMADGAGCITCLVGYSIYFGFFALNYWPLILS